MICRTCKNDYPVTIEYYPPRQNYKNGLGTECRKCCRIRNTEWTRKYRKNNKIKIKGYKEKYYATHREQISENSMRYHKNNPDLVNKWQKKHRDSHPIILKAYRKVNNNPELVTVLTECPCNYPRKHKHHPDYNKPFEVIRLCPSCHAAEHARLRSLQPALAEAI